MLQRNDLKWKKKENQEKMELTKEKKHPLGYINCTGAAPMANRPHEMRSSSTLPWSMGIANRLGHNEAFLIVIPLASASLTIFNPLKPTAPW